MNTLIMRHPAQRRILTVLVAAQILSGAGLAAGITVGAQLAQDMLAKDMLGITSAAGLPAALFTIGSALAAVLVAPQATGDVLEVAIGTGRNLPHYPADVRLTGLDLSPDTPIRGRR